MTNEERKVIELALAVLEKIATVNAMDYEYQRWAKEHLVTIKEALAQPDQDQDEVDIRSRLYQRIHELETQLAQPEQEYGVVAGVGKGVEIPAGVKYYYIEPKLPPQHKE